MTRHTISGVNVFVSQGQWHEGVDDDQVCASNYDMSLSCNRTLFVSKSMTSDGTGKPRMNRADDETFKIIVNDHYLISNGASDNQTRVHHTGTIWASQCDSPVHSWSIAAIKSEVRRHLMTSSTPMQK